MSCTRHLHDVANPGILPSSSRLLSLAGVMAGISAALGLVALLIVRAVRKARSDYLERHAVDPVDVLMQATGRESAGRTDEFNEGFTAGHGGPAAPQRGRGGRGNSRTPRPVPRQGGGANDTRSASPSRGRQSLELGPPQRR